MELMKKLFNFISSTDLGALLIDGFGDGICISGKNKSKSSFNKKLINRTSFGILQACRVRISKQIYCMPFMRTDPFRSCRSNNKKSVKRTNILKAFKIAIMGCIVNGPGEMADADYGYVGSGPSN
jgi:(E)-4-hydroxy-3-methylbut-2-enyl-diphosphate synthase